MIWVALAVAVLMTLAQHMGLPEAIARVVLQVARCAKCLTFWTCLMVLILLGCNPLVAASLSLCAAYSTYWIGLAFIMLNKLYERLWQLLTRK